MKRVIVDTTLGGWKVELEGPLSDGFNHWPFDHQFTSDGHYANGEPHDNFTSAKVYAEALAQATNSRLQVRLGPADWSIEDKYLSKK